MSVLQGITEGKTKVRLQGLGLAEQMNLAEKQPAWACELLDLQQHLACDAAFV